MPEENIVGAVKSEIEERLDYAGEAVKGATDATVSVPGEVAVLAADFLTGAGDVAGDTVGDVTDAVIHKIKQGLAVLESLGGVVTGD